MKKRRKHRSCLNCGDLLLQKNNFCPNCGQENTDNEVGIGILIREFYSTFFTVDSRFGRTFKPFLFKPGKITVEFNEGKRVKYANPFRWYLVISIIHFFFMTNLFELKSSNKQDETFIDITIEPLSANIFDSLYSLPDSLHATEWPICNAHIAMIDYLNKDTSLTTNKIMDSLKFNELPLIKRLLAKQIIKITKESSSSINKYILENIPFIVFFNLPLFALLLLLFFRKNGHYIKHLIHTLHIHAFYFFLMSWVWIISLLFDFLEGYSIIFATIISIIYVVISFKRVYEVKIGWSLLRLFLIGIIYAFIVAFIFTSGIVLSLTFF